MSSHPSLYETGTVKKDLTFEKIDFNFFIDCDDTFNIDRYNFSLFFIFKSLFLICKMNKIYLFHIYSELNREILMLTRLTANKKKINGAYNSNVSLR